MPSVDINHPGTREQIAAIASIFGAIACGILANTPEGNPLIGAAIGFFVSMALAIFNRGMGILIILASALLILAECSGNA